MHNDDTKKAFKENSKEVAKSEENNNTSATSEENGKEIAEPERQFYDVEMSVDEELFVGDPTEISEGSFVSFRYIGEAGSDAPPINPKISVPCSRRK